MLNDTGEISVACNWETERGTFQTLLGQSVLYERRVFDVRSYPDKPSFTFSGVIDDPEETWDNDSELRVRVHVRDIEIIEISMPDFHEGAD